MGTYLYSASEVEDRNKTSENKDFSSQLGTVIQSVKFMLMKLLMCEQYFCVQPVSGVISLFMK